MEDLLQVEIVKLEEELNKLKSAVEYIETAKISIEAASKIINTITKLKDEFEKLSEKAYILINKFDKLEIPLRFDKVDSQINSRAEALNTELQNLQSRFEVVSKSLISEMKATSKNFSAEVHENNSKIISLLDKQSKSIKLIQYGLIGIYVFIVVVVILFYLKII